jgi:hypothetical protein
MNVFEDSIFNAIAAQNATIFLVEQLLGLLFIQGRNACSIGFWVM